MSIISDIVESTKAIIKGMSTTFSYIPREKWTVQYPECTSTSTIIWPRKTNSKIKGDEERT